MKLLAIEGVDLQPCGGTHVANTRGIGTLKGARIEKKSAALASRVIEFAPSA